MATTAFRRAPSVTGSLAPSYTTNDIELARLDDATPTASLNGDLDNDDDDEAPPPPYNHGGGAFNPTVHLQIQTAGKRLISLPVPPRPEPILIHRVDTNTGEVDAAPSYLSLRPKRSSGNCTLVQASDPTQRPLSSTTYRFGPGRPPQVQLFDPSSSTLPTITTGSSSSSSSDAAAETPLAYDTFPLESRGLLTRAQKLKTRLGAFEWRYATRKERKAAGADSLLVLDRVMRVFRAGGGAEEEQRTPVAHLVRSAGLRSPGSSPSSAGNGGRLLIDPALWSGDDASKRDREMAEVLVVTTCVSMLKKEVDRRRAQQMAVMMSAAAGGGGP